MSIHQVYGPRYKEDLKERDRIVDKFYDYLRSPRCVACIVGVLKKKEKDVSIAFKHLMKWSQTNIVKSGVTQLSEREIRSALKDGLASYGIELLEDDVKCPELIVKYNADLVGAAYISLEGERQKEAEEVMIRARSVLDTDIVVYTLYKLVMDIMNDGDNAEVKPIADVLRILKDVDPKYRYRKIHRRKLQTLLEEILVSKGFLITDHVKDCKFCGMWETNVIGLPPPE